MIKGKLKQSNYGLTVFILGLFVLVGAFAGVLPNRLSEGWGPFLIIAVVFVAFIVAFGSYLEAKGYSGNVALLLLLIPFVGPAIALFLPDKDATESALDLSGNMGHMALEVVRLVMFSVVPLTVMALKVAAESG